MRANKTMNYRSFAKQKGERTAEPRNQEGARLSLREEKT